MSEKKKDVKPVMGVPLKSFSFPKGEKLNFNTYVDQTY